LYKPKRPDSGCNWKKQSENKFNFIDGLEQLNIFMGSSGRRGKQKKHSLKYKR
jgi:hypothetical protein